MIKISVLYLDDKRSINVFFTLLLRYFSIYLLLLYSSFSIAQNTNNEDLFIKQRAIIIYNLIRQTGWDNIDQLREFEIGVLGDDPIVNELTKMGENRTIVGLPIVVTKFSAIDQIEDAQLLYVNKKFDYDIESVATQIRGKNTLLITENYLFNESMINIITTNNIFQFELNEDYLNNERFVVTPVIRQLAITSSERWREMYEASQKNLGEERTKVNEQLEILEGHKKEIEKQTTQLRQQKISIDRQATLLKSQKTELNRQSAELNRLLLNYQLKIKALDSLEKHIETQKESIVQQLLAILKQDSILNAQDKSISSQVELINQHEITLAQQQSVIKLQQQFNYLLIALFILAFVAAFLIFKSYRNKKIINKQLHQLNHEKNTLIGVVSHDLRSPVNQIKGLANIMLLEGVKGFNDRQKEYLKSIITSCERQIDMIRRILDVNAIESNKINLKLEKENLFDITDAVIGNFQLSASNKSIELSLQNNCTSPHAMVDKNYLIQVLENIISNAIKYSENGKKVVVSIHEISNKVIVAIADEGPGICKEDKEKMFGIYQKLSAKPTAGEESYGLGLSIAKKYIEAMGGTIGCKSELDEGATFELQFNKV